MKDESHEQDQDEYYRLLGQRFDRRMTVQDLIDQLQNITNKTSEVKGWCEGFGSNDVYNIGGIRFFENEEGTYLILED